MLNQIKAYKNTHKNTILDDQNDDSYSESKDTPNNTNNQNTISQRETKPISLKARNSKNKFSEQQIRLIEQMIDERIAIQNAKLKLMTKKKSKPCKDSKESLETIEQTLD